MWSPPASLLGDPHRDVGAAIFLLRGEDAETEPLLRCALEARIADQDQLSSAFLGSDRDQTHPGPGHRPQVAADIAPDRCGHSPGSLKTTSPVARSRRI